MAAIHANRIGELWQQRMDTLREYEVIRDGNVFGTNLFNNAVLSSEYDQAREQLCQLEKQYAGVEFETLFPGEEIKNEGGVCISLESRHPLDIVAIDIERLTRDILADLTLVRGIGEITRKRLNVRGYFTIADLVQNPKFRSSAGQVLEQLSEGNSAEIMDMIGSRHAKSHPFVLGTAGFHEPEDYVFLDIETLGLFSRPIILFGVGTIERGALCVHQYLLRDIDEEQAALIATMGHFSRDHPALVTFNGKSFDYPYLRDRLAYYRMGSASPVTHYDVLHFSRRRWKGMFPSLRLSALEQEILGVCRTDDIPGAMVPEFYETFLKTKNCGPLVPIVEHNRQDVVSLALLFFRLLGESYGCR
ncbi:MAG: ribonuclease H-like domain-containing protein [Methanoregula sp.]